MTDFSDLTENQLILLVQSTGENGAFAELVKNHQQALMTFLTHFTKNPATAEDLMQDTFIKSYQNIKQFKANSSFKTWLFSIGYREFLHYVRKAKRTNIILQSFHRVAELSRKSKQANQQNVSTKMDIEKALLKLPESQRTVIVLCNQVGMSHSEAAEVLAIPLGTVKTHIRAAKLSMKRYLGDHYEN